MERKRIIQELSTPAGEELFQEAEEVCKRYIGEQVYIRGIIEFSNYCFRDCLYCGLRRSNKRIKRYRMREEEIVSLAEKIILCGIKTVVLQSGDDMGFSAETLSRIISKIKKRHPEVAITLCVGERDFEDYKAFKDAGADRYLLKQETSNPSLYARLHPGQSLKRRLEILEYLKRIGYQIGAGNIVGLPGQRIEDLADDLLLLQALEVDMAGIGPFIPQQDTPLANFAPPGLDLTLRVLALARIITKNAHLPATTALATLDPQRGQILGLRIGANVLMPDFTPEGYRERYTIYDNKRRVDLEEAKKVVRKARKKFSTDRGDSLKNRSSFQKTGREEISSQSVFERRRYACAD